MYESGHNESPPREELRTALRRLEEVLLRQGRQLPPLHEDKPGDVLLQLVRRYRGVMQQELERLRALLAMQR